MKLLFDLGATHTRLALTDGHRLERIKHLSTDASHHGLDSLVKQLRQYLAGETITAVAGGIPGQLDSHTGRLVHAPNLPQWHNLPVVTRLEEALGVPVHLTNDTALAGLGEAVYGAGEGQRIVVYVTISTGVNGARITDGRIDPSARGYEIGSMLLPTGRGAEAFESLVGGAAMLRRRHLLPSQVTNPAVWVEEARTVALGLYNTILHWSPDVVVLGGAMMRDIDVAVVQRELETLPPVYENWPPIKRAELEQDGGLYGAMVYLEAL